ncbi:MAG: type II toxin-antitoxin system VapC family toxin [Solirubrobacterales bacterium]
MILYVDTSALVKLVLVEQGSDLAAELWTRSSRAVSSILAYPEGRAALAAARRSGRLGTALYAESLKKFEKTFEQLLSIEVDDRLAMSAGEGAASFGLRGADAVHLATALGLVDEEVTFVTWDQDLADAAASAGLAVAGAPV